MTGRSQHKREHTVTQGEAKTNLLGRKSDSYLTLVDVGYRPGEGIRESSIRLEMFNNLIWVVITHM